MAGASLLAALLLWNAVFFFFVLILLGLTTAVIGDWGAGVPRWIHLAAGGGAAFLFLWGMLDEGVRRYRGITDRTIIGWHVAGDVLLLPVRITFAIWGNLGAVLMLSPSETYHAWRLLEALRKRRKTHAHELGQLDSRLSRVHRSLEILQILDLVHRFQGREDAWYLVNESAVEPMFAH